MVEGSIPGAIRKYCALLSTVEDSADSFAIEGRAEFPASCCVFEGHFPETPVLPAVVQLGIVRSITESALDVELFPVAAEKVKFKEMVVPQEEFLISVKLNKKERKWKVRFTLHKNGGGNIASGTVTYTENS